MLSFATFVFTFYTANANVLVAGTNSPSSEVHFSPECFLGSGYDIWSRSCMDAPPILIPEKCTSESKSNANCIETEAGESGWTSYNQKVTSTSDFQGLMSTAVKAEGQGWGVSVSVSASYMQQHTTTSNTIGFWIGTSGDTYSTIMRNPTELELNDAAKGMLATNWRQFIESYGTHYVERVIYSTRFIGSAQISSKSEESSSSLDVAASMSYKGFFSASGSGDYKKATRGSHSELETKVQSFYMGELLTYTDGPHSSAAEELKEAHEQWKRNVKAHPEKNSAATRLVYRSWYDLKEVQSLIFENYNRTEQAEIVEVFKAEFPTMETLKVITQEYIKAGAQLNTLALFSDYKCVRNNPRLAEEIQDYTNQLTSHIAAIENLSQARIMELQAQMLKRDKKHKNGDFSWFISRDWKFQTAISKKLKECPKDVCSCNFPMTANNHITCTQTGRHQCEWDEVCFESGSIRDQNYRALCRKDLCSCTAPGASAPAFGAGEITCSYSGKRDCTPGVTCKSSHGVHWGQWDTLCGLDMCHCNYPGSSVFPNNAQISCTQSGIRYCGTGTLCTGHSSVHWGKWDQLCSASGRRLELTDGEEEATAAESLTAPLAMSESL